MLLKKSPSPDQNLLSARGQNRFSTASTHSRHYASSPLLRSGAIYWWPEALIGQIKFFQRQLAKHIGLTDAALRKFDDSHGDKSCGRIITNFQMQRVAGRYESSGRIFDGFRVKSLIGEKGSDRHDVYSYKRERDRFLSHRRLRAEPLSVMVQPAP